MNNIEKLMQLAKENPDLQIIPMVDSDVVPDDTCSSWMGSFGDCEIGAYFIDDDGNVYFDEDKLIDGIILEHCEEEDWIDLSDKEQELKAKEIAASFMTKAIIVNINLPEV